MLNRSLYWRTAPSLARSATVFAELKKILPFLSSDEFSGGKKKISAASVAIATAFSRTTANTALFHAPDCPVVARRIPITTIADESSFRSRPCMTCVKQRAHFLASEVFCADFEKQCVTKGKQPHQGEQVELPEALKEEVIKSFSTFVAFREHVLTFARNAQTPGRTWIVYSRDDKIAVINLPANELPLVFGLWPLAVVNMTEKKLCNELLNASHSQHEMPALPAWSRAARNPSAATDIHTSDATLAKDGRLVTLDSVRAILAASTVASMNWDFVNAQLKTARAYFTSKERTEKQSDYRRKREAEVTQRVMGQLRDSGAVVMTGEAVDVAREAAHTETRAPAEVKEGENAGKMTERAQEAVTFAALPAAAATEATTTTTTAIAEERVEASPAAAESPVDPQTKQLEDGTWEYRYKSGDITLVRPDGTKVFKTEGMTTTVHADGSTLFEYSNSTSILDRSDGMRITTYPDGTSKEERIKQN